MSLLERLRDAPVVGATLVGDDYHLIVQITETDRDAVLAALEVARAALDVLYLEPSRQE